MLTGTELRMKGVSLTETLIMMPVFLMLTLGIIQYALIYEAKTTLDYAVFMAARAGAVEHAQQGAITKGLAKSLSPLFSPDLHDQASLQATIAKARAEVTAFSDIKIINPTVEAFDDFGINENGRQAIPNSMLHVRDPEPGKRSRVNIQDANLLKIQVLYGHSLKVPFVNRIISTVTSWFTTDPVKLAYLSEQRVPILATATVRMQSTPWKNDWMMRLADVNKAVEDSNQPGKPLNLATLPRPWGGPTGDRDRGSASQNVRQGGANPGSDPGTAPDASADNEESFNEGTGQGSPRACDENQTTSQPTSVQAVSAGNPVHIVTGNKYQREVDIAPVSYSAGLAFARHYNSQSSYHSVMGYGWSHTYDIQLKVLASGIIKLRQADGRHLYFKPDQMDQFQPQQASDGKIHKLQNGYDWVWSNGKTFQFNNQGRLTHITNADGDVLNLVYIGHQLHKVIDNHQRTLLFRYSKQGHIREILDPAGKQYLFRYDHNNNLISVTNPAGHLRIYHFEDPADHHNLTGITDERGIRYAKWAYDDQDRAVLSTHADNVEKITLEYMPAETRVTNSLGVSTIYHTGYRNGVPIVSKVDGPGCSSCGKNYAAYQYNSRLQLTQITGHDGISRRYHYDDLSRLIQISEHSGNKARIIAKYGYEGIMSKPVLITEPSINPEAMHQWWLTYTDDEQIKGITEIGYTTDGKNSFQRMTRTTKYGYENNRPSFIDGPLKGKQDRINYIYAADGELTSLQPDKGRVIPLKKTTKDAYGRPKTLTSEAGTVSQLTYNHRGQLNSLMYQTGVSSTAQIKLNYDPAGRLNSLIGPEGEARITYDTAGRPIKVISPSGHNLQWEWNTESKIISRKILTSEGNTLSQKNYKYNKAGQLSTLEQGEQVSQYRYDHRGRLKFVTDPLNNETHYRYDVWGRPVSFIKATASPTPVTEHIRYDTHNRQIKLTDGRGNSSHTAYDDFGNRLYRYTPDGGVILYRYNARGQVIAKVDESAVITRFDYDESGRLKGIGAFDMPAMTHYDYSDNNEKIQDGLYQKTTYQYDLKGNIIRKDSYLKDLGKRYSTHYRYNKIGRLQSKTLPDGQILNYRYDNEGRIQSITRKGLFWDDDLISGLQFTTTGKLESLTTADGRQTSFTYDSYNRLKTEYTPGLRTRNYAYNAVGKLVNLIKNSNHYTYQYDALDRLIKASGGNSEYVWTYDNAGNRTQSTVNGKTQVYKYAKDSNRLLKQGDQQLTYKATGEPVFKGSLRYDYTLGGRPAKVYKGRTLLAEYRYNSEGERIRKIDHTVQPAKTTYYLYENKQLTAEIDSKGNIIRQYLYMAYRPVVAFQQKDIYTIHNDHRGAPEIVINDTGKTVWQATYSPFGEATLLAENFIMNLRLPGQYYDAETGTHYNIYRDYDPKSGRYLTSDPLGIEAGFNTYTYVTNDPLNRIDPLGLYDEITHYTMTYFLAIVAGLDENTARIMATATQYVDDNPDTRPIDPPVSPNLEALPLYHFTADYNSINRGDVSSHVRSRFIHLDVNGNPLKWSQQLINLYTAAMQYNYDGCLLKGGSTRTVKTILFGEFIHAYEDQFSHRDANNVPIDRPYMGHGPEGKRPDYTFNQWDDNLEENDGLFGGNHCGGPIAPLIGSCDSGIWRYNELRSLQMEKETFILIRRSFREEINQRRELEGKPTLSDKDYENETAKLWYKMAGDGNSRIGRPDKDDPYGEEADGKTGVLQEFNAMESFINGKDNNGKEISMQWSEKVELLDKWLRINLPRPNSGVLDYNDEYGESNRNIYIDRLERANHPGVFIPINSEAHIAP